MSIIDYVFQVDPQLLDLSHRRLRVASRTQKAPGEVHGGSLRSVSHRRVYGTRDEVLWIARAVSMSTTRPSALAF